jgi:hypothetical protein
MYQIVISAAVAAMFLAAGCGKPSPRAVPQAGPVAAPTNTVAPVAPEPIAVAAPIPAAQAASNAVESPKPVDPFYAKMSEVECLEQTGEFRKAMLALRQMRKEFRDPRQILDIDAAMDRVRGLMESGVGSGDAAVSLGSSDRRVADVAKRQLLASGPAGLILLRKALQTGTSVAAMNAAEALADSHDRESIPLMLTRLEMERGRTPLALSLMKTLTRIEDLLTAEQLAVCDQLLEKAEGITRCELAGVLESALVKRAEGKQDEYEKLIGRPGAYERLREAFTRAVISGDESLVRWSCKEGTTFLPSVRGFHGTYFSDVGQVNPVFERFDAVINKTPEESTPYPNGQQTGFSIRWDADLLVGAAGKYNFGVTADDQASLSINGATVAVGNPWQQGAGAIALSAGVHRIRVDYVQNEGPISYRVWWNGPGIPDTVNLPVSTRPMADQMIALTRTLNDLLSTNWTASRAVKDRVVAAGEAGAIALRDAVVRSEEPVAAAAAEYLAMAGDARMFTALLKRAGDPRLSAALRPRLAEAMRRVAGTATEADCRAMLAALAGKGDGGPDAKVALAGLCAVLNLCGGKDEAFNKRCGQTDAYAVVKAAADRLLDSDEPVDAAWMAAFGQPLVSFAPGLSGRYWRGSRQDQFAFDRMDGQLDFMDRVPPLTDAGMQELSAVWEGNVWVPADGEYKFYLRAQNEGVVWLDDEYLVGGGWRHQDAVAARKLSAGLHRIRATLRFWNDAPAMNLQWDGPNLPRQVVPWYLFSAPPSAAAVSNAVVALARLPGLTNLEVRVASQRTVRAIGGAAAPVLVHAIRTAPEPVAAEAVAILIELPVLVRDSRAVSALVSRSGKVSTDALRLSLARGLQEMAEKTVEADCRKMLDALKDGAGMDRLLAMAGLCAVLDRACAGKADDFNKRCGEAGAYGTVKAAVEQSLASSNTVEIGWALSFGRPFSPLMPGLRARYWRGEGFEAAALERSEERIEMLEKVVGFTDAGNFPLSARWEGYLNVPATGDYRITVSAQNEGRVWIDGQRVVEFAGHRHQGATGPAKLTAGLHRFKAELKFNSDAPGMRVSWEGPNLQGQIIAGGYYLTEPWPAVAAAAAAAIGRMTNRADVQGFTAAKRAAMLLGSAATPVLAQTFRDRPEPVALDALVAMRERVEEWPAGFADVILDRAGKPATPELRRQMGEAIRAMSAAIPEATCKRMLSALAGGGGDRDVVLAGLCAVLDRACAGKPEAFGTRCGDGGAYETLRTAVEKELASTNRVEVAWATAFGQPFAPLAQGLRVSYWRGGQFDVPMFERIEERIEQYERIPGIVEQNNPEFSARWEGRLTVPASGDYRFFLCAQNFGQVWIDGRPVVTHNGHRSQETAGTVKLTAGPHDIRADLRFWNDWPAMRLAWEGPNLQRQVIPGNFYATAVTPAMVADGVKALGRLRGMDNESLLIPARRSIMALGPAAAPLLRQAVREGPGSPTAVEALRFLMEMRDEETARLLLDTAAKDAAARVSGLWIEGMASLAGGLNADRLGECLAQVRQAKTADMDVYSAALCAALVVQCNGDAGRFNALLKDPKAYDTVKAAVGGALASSDLKVVTRACRSGQPFAPYVPGFRTRYYFGDAFDRLLVEQTEGNARIWEYRGPQNWRGENVSVIHEGVIQAPVAGEYVFRMTTRCVGEVRLGGRPLLAFAGTEQNAAATLSPGLHPVEIRQRQPGNDVSHMIDTDRTPVNGQRAPLGPDLVRSVPSAATLDGMERLLREMVDGDAGKSSAARAVLNTSGDLGLVYLRHAARYGAEKTAVAAAGLLASQRPPDAAALLAETIRRFPKATAMAELVEALAGVADGISPADAAWISSAKPDATGLSERLQLQLIAAIAERNSRCDKTAFNALFQDRGPDAWNSVAARFDVFLQSLEDATVFWALEAGGPFVPAFSGVRGRFYDGQAFDRKYVDVREEAVDRNGEPFHNHGNPLSAWWTGWFDSSSGGRYRFGIKADDGARLWVDGQLVADGWLSAPGLDLAGEIDLKPGRHTVDVRYRQNDRDRYVYANVRGPGIEGRMDLRFMRAGVPQGVSQSVLSEIGKLANDNQVNEGRQRASEWRPISDVFLKRMIRTAPVKVAERAASLMAEWKDPEGRKALSERLGRETDATARKPLEEVLKRYP